MRRDETDWDPLAGQATALWGNYFSLDSPEFDEFCQQFDAELGRLEADFASFVLPKRRVKRTVKKKFPYPK